MALKNIMLAKARRNEPCGDIELQLRQAANDTDGIAYSVFEQAKQGFNRSANKQFGFFDPDAENKQWLGLLKEWLTGKLPFDSMANKAANHLHQLLAPTEAPFTAMWVFAHESILGQEYCYFYWLPLVEAIIPQAELEPARTEIIDAGKLQYGIRLDIEQWQQDESPKYLTIMSLRGNRELSEAIKAFANFAEGIDTSQQTSEFLGIVDEFSETLPEDKAKNMKTAILDYCIEQDKIGNPVLLKDISEQLDQQAPDRFERFVHEKQPEPLDEIHTHRQSLKRYMRYFGRDHSLSISFSAERFGQDILYHPARGSLTIEKLPKNLKIQLSNYGEKDE